MKLPASERRQHRSSPPLLPAPAAAGRGRERRDGQANTFLERDLAPQLEVEETDFGIRIFAVRDASADERYVRVTNFIYPNLSAFSAAIPDGYSVNWHVPIDDTRHWKYMFNFSRGNPVDKDLMERLFFGDQLTPDYRFKRNKSNRYLQDREEMQYRSFIGLGGNFILHDVMATEGAGLVQDRTQEHTASSDKAIVLERVLLLRALEQLAAGNDAPHAIRRPEENHLGHLGGSEHVVPKSVDWKAYVHQRIEDKVLSS